MTRVLLIRKLRKALSQFQLLPRTLSLVYAAAPRLTLAWLALLLVQGLLPLAPVYLARPLVDGLVNAVRSHGDFAAVRPALIAIALIAAAALLSEVLRAAASWVRSAHSELVQDHIAALIHRKSVQADLAFYDSPEFFDHLHRARIEASYRPVALLDTLGGLLQNSITLVAMLAVIAPFGLWLPAALFLATLPALAVVLRFAVRRHQWRLTATPRERRAWYYDWLLTARESAAELRLFALGARFASAYDSLRTSLRNESLALARSQALAELAAGAIALLCSAAALGYVAWRAVTGAISLGSLALFYQAFNQGLRLMRSLLEGVGQLYYNSLFLGNLFEFLALEPRIVDPPHATPAPARIASGIRFRHVMFSYPGASRATLSDFDLRIPAGSIVAFVGPNGAGKSTLIKLLCRFYDPNRGAVELDGTDIREFPLDDLRRRIAVLFQEPVRYNDTVSAAIALGDAASDASPEAVKAAAAAAGADEIVTRLPQGYDNLLGKSFLEGAELSGGEWQRIALARAFYRSAPVLILDEPTSAMDPWAETDWLDRFRALAARRTAIIVTHRLTTAMRADVIHVLSEGRIVESGSHDELLAAGGPYAESWLAQTTRSAQDAVLP